MGRLELLGGSNLAGNDGIKQTISQIVHTLNKFGIINNGQSNDLVKEYVIYLMSIYYIDTSVLLENIPLVKFIKTTSGTRVVYFP